MFYVLLSAFASVQKYFSVTDRWEGVNWRWVLANNASRYVNFVYIKAEYTWRNTEMYCFLGTCVCLFS